MSWVKTAAALAVLTAIVLAPSESLAQSGTSTITGIVKDTSGGTVPGARVNVVNEDTGVAINTETNVDGLYRVGALVPGKYRLEIELDGFQPVLRQISVEVG